MNESTLCNSVEGTTGCERETQLDPKQAGWVTVYGEWWCASCFDRYGFVPDPDPGAKHQEDQ